MTDTISIIFFSVSKILFSDSMLILALLFFWFNALMDLMTIRQFDTSAKQIASIIYAVHFFFLIAISGYIIRSL